jgi:hypothetical protein
VRYHSVRYVDGKAVRRIAASTLREKDEIPWTVIGASSFGSRRQGEASTTNAEYDQASIHALSPRISLIFVRQLDHSRRG